MTRLFPLLLAAALAGCDALGEPERYVNDAARPPAAGALDLGRVRPGQHVASEVTVDVGLDSLAGRVASVRVFVDGEPFQNARGETTFGTRFTLDTRRYPEGAHTLTAEVRLVESRLGLLGLAGAPDAVLTARLVFDQTPPTAVDAVSVAFGDDRRPRVAWTESADPNFYAYLITRRPVHAAPWPGAGGVVVDTVYGRAQTSLVGAPVPDLIGVEVRYDVRVWNRDRTGPAQGASAVYGPASAPLAVLAGVSAPSADGSRLYVHGGGGVVEVSAATLEPLRRHLIVGLGIPVREVPSRDDLHLAGGRLYASTGGPFAVVDVETFEEDPSFTMPGETGRFAVAGGHVYTVEGDGSLYTVDAVTAEVVATLEGAFGPHHSAVLGRSPDGRSLYVLDAGERGGPAALVRVDLGAGGPRPAESAPLPALGTDGVGFEAGLAVAPDGRVVLLQSQTVTVFDGRSLRPLARYTSPTADPEVGSRAVAVRGSRAYAVFLGGSTEGAGETVELDLDGLAPLRRWAFREAPAGLAFGASGSLLAFVSDRTWILSL